MQSPLLKLHQVTKSFGDTTAVDHVSLDVGRGEFLTFLGPSGSGKTTTLMMVAGFESLSAGSLQLNNQALDPLPPYKRNIGFVFQHYALFPHMTVTANVAFPLRMRNHNKADIKRQVDYILNLVGLPNYGDRFPKQLSGGQQQRVALARAMVFNPQLLLMDEPLGALDKKLREHMQIEIMHLHQELGVTILYVTHDQEEALMMSDRIAVFNNGKIEQIGTPSELYDQPQTRFVADFIGETNIISGQIKQKQVGNQAILESDGICIAGVCTTPLSIGDKAIATIRPERIRLAPVTSATINTLQGQISDCIYLGQTWKIVIRRSEQLICTVRLPTGQASPAIGDTVVLSWDTKAVRLFSDTTEKI